VLDAFRQAVFGDEAPRLARAALGIFVQATAAAADDEEALADAAAALDQAEALLRANGYEIALTTASEILGVALAPATPADELAARRAAAELVRRVYAELRGATPVAVKLSVTLHADEVHLRAGGGQVAGGPLLEFGAWSRPGEGVSITSRAATMVPLVNGP